MVLGIVCLIIVLLLFAYLQFSKNDTRTTDSGGGSSANVYNFPGGKGGVNNPGFLIHTNITWQGKTNSDGCKFENFESLTYGIRAWYVNLFGKVKKGTIKNTSQMIDVLTPASKENSETARNNYKSHVSQATDWLELGIAVFDFEANSDWKTASSDDKRNSLQSGFQKAVSYSYGGNVPAYFNN